MVRNRSLASASEFKAFETRAENIVNVSRFEQLIYFLKQHKYPQCSLYERTKTSLVEESEQKVVFEVFGVKIGQVNVSESNRLVFRMPLLCTSSEYEECPSIGGSGSLSARHQGPSGRTGARAGV